MEPTSDLGDHPRGPSGRHTTRAHPDRQMDRCAARTVTPGGVGRFLTTSTLPLTSLRRPEQRVELGSELRVDDYRCGLSTQQGRV